MVFFLIEYFGDVQVDPVTLLDILRVHVQHFHRLILDFGPVEFEVAPFTDLPFRQVLVLSPSRISLAKNIIATSVTAPTLVDRLNIERKVDLVFVIQHEEVARAFGRLYLYVP